MPPEDFIEGLVAPARERGLKFVNKIGSDQFNEVAPARERGLKFSLAD